MTYTSTAAKIVTPSINLEGSRVGFEVLRYRIMSSNQVAIHQITSPISTARNTRRLYHLIKIPLVKSWNNKSIGVRAAYTSVLARTYTLSILLNGRWSGFTKTVPLTISPCTPFSALTTKAARRIAKILKESTPCTTLMPQKTLGNEGIWSTNGPLGKQGSRRRSFSEGMIDLETLLTEVTH